MLQIKFSDSTGGAVYRGVTGGYYENGDLKKPAVTVNGDPLDPRFDLDKMSASGFNWGYGGAGPSQLALAVIAHAAGDAVALAEWYRFRKEVIEKLDMQRPFAFTARDVAAFLRREPITVARFIPPFEKPVTAGFWKQLMHIRA